MGDARAVRLARRPGGGGGAPYAALGTKTGRVPVRSHEESG